MTEKQRPSVDTKLAEAIAAFLALVIHAEVTRQEEA